MTVQYCIGAVVEKDVHSIHRRIEILVNMGVCCMYVLKLRVDMDTALAAQLIGGNAVSLQAVLLCQQALHAHADGEGRHAAQQTGPAFRLSSSVLTGSSLGKYANAE